MAGGMTPKVRLVRCPKCRLVLPEVADVPVYRCGGCDTVLVAKNRKTAAKSLSVSQETEPAQTNDCVRSSEHEACNRSSHESFLPSTTDCSSGRESWKDPKVSGECYTEKLDVGLSNEVQQNGHSGNDQKASGDCCTEKLDVGLSNEVQQSGHCGNDQKASGNCNSEQLVVNLSNEKQQDGNQLYESSDYNVQQPGFCSESYSSSKFSDHENEESLAGANSEVHANHKSSDLELANLKSDCTGGNLSIENAVAAGENNLIITVSVSAAESISRDSLVSSQNEEPEQPQGSDNLAFPHVTSTDSYGTTDFVSHGSELRPPGENLLPDTPVSSPNEELEEPKSRDHHAFAHVTSMDTVGTTDSANPSSDLRPAQESISSDGVFSSPNEELEKPQVRDRNRFDHVESLDTFGTTEFDNSSELRAAGVCSPNEALEKPHTRDQNGLAHLDSRDTFETTDFGSPSSELTAASDSSPNERLEKPQMGNQHDFSHLEYSDKFGTTDFGSPNSKLRAAGEGIFPNTPFPSPNERPEVSHTSNHHGFVNMRSSDTFETEDFVTPSSELSGTLENFPKSTTIRSSHAYDGSISSYDGMDDYFPDRHMHRFENTHKFFNHFVPVERPRRHKFLVNGNSRMGYHEQSFSSDLSNKKHQVRKSRKWDQDEPLEPIRHGYAIRNGKRLERHGYPSDVPFSERASLARYESASSSSHLHDELPRKSIFHPLDKPEYTEQEKMKLLRMVYEQLNKTCYLNGKPKGMSSAELSWKEKHFPRCHEQEAPEEDDFHARYIQRLRQRSNWNQQSKFSRIPYSGDAINSRVHVDRSCLCCHRQDWQCPAVQSRAPIFSHDQGFCMVHDGHSCYNSYSSCPSTPQRYVESEFPSWSCETKSDDQRYKDHQLKRYLRDKHHSAKRHLRPTAGGAPFITCYSCLKPLQLPADFLLFKRRFHKLRCGACSEVLRFSLRNGIHIVPYEVGAVEPLPSEADDSIDDVQERILTSASYGNRCSHADPVSYSEDYGNSFCKSCSTDGELPSLASFNNVQNNADVGIMSYSASKPMENRKEFVLKQSQNAYRNPVEVYKSSGPSSSRSKSENASSEIKELRRAGGSPLHLLMGYSSPSRVIYRS